MNVEDTLRSSELLVSIASKCRGVPSKKTLGKVIIQYDLNEEVAKRMESILQRVVMGIIVFSSDVDRSPDSISAVLLLGKVGFLHEDFDGRLHFTSAMHLKVWLKSIRKGNTAHLPKNETMEEFMMRSIGKMSCSRLSSISTEKKDNIRERQLQMELYAALASALPIEYLVTPEWRTLLKDGYVDLVIRGKDFHWFIELLVDGDDAIGQGERFQAGNKYHSYLLYNLRYILIDFRQKRRSVRISMDQFLYVSFGDDFKVANFNYESKVSVIPLSE